MFSLEDAKREIKIEEELSKSNLIIPQKTIALYSIKSPFRDEDTVAIIQKIDTEFRADEYCSILLTNLFYDIFGKDCKINLKESRFRFKRYPLNKALQMLKKKYAKSFFQIGQNIGFIYKTIHDFGYTRGISNSWYGNELICENGDIGICDLESCFSKKEIKEDSLFEELKKNRYSTSKNSIL